MCALCVCRVCVCECAETTIRSTESKIYFAGETESDATHTHTYEHDFRIFVRLATVRSTSVVWCGWCVVWLTTTRLECKAEPRSCTVFLLAAKNSVYLNFFSDWMNSIPNVSLFFPLTLGASPRRRRVCPAIQPASQTAPLSQSSHSGLGQNGRLRR